MLRGGGVAFGPKPRDFSTELQRKVYDLAVRTALSARYRRGELLVVGGEMQFEGVGEWSLERYVGEMLEWNGLRGSLFVKNVVSEEEEMDGGFFGVLGRRREARGLGVSEVDVKDLLSGKRVVIERRALERLLGAHQTDLAEGMRVKRWGGDLLEGSA